MMNILAIASSKNTKDKKDASHVFIPEAKNFLKIHNPDTELNYIDCINIVWSDRKTILYDILRNVEEKIDVFAMFCHGWPTGIQFGIDLKNIDTMARMLANISKPNLKVVFYTCLTAENKVKDNNISNIGAGTDSGFADILRDKLVRYGITDGWVDAHKYAGHSTMNPYVVRFMCNEVEDPEIGGEGGDWLIKPGTLKWKKWIKLMRDSKENMRFLYPLMTKEDIEYMLI